MASRTLEREYAVRSMTSLRGLPLARSQITWALNGQPLEVWSDLAAGQRLERTWRLTPLSGRNRLTMTLKAFNGAGSNFASGDSRALSVMFGRFDLKFQ
jgi:hypothetical protein